MKASTLTTKGFEAESVTALARAINDFLHDDAGHNRVFVEIQYRADADKHTALLLYTQ